MRRAFFSLILLVLAPACAAKNGGLKADLSKIRPWSASLAEPLPAPYMVDYVAGAKALSFLAVEHSNEATSPSLRLVGQVMDAHKFSAVVVEGVTRSQGISPVSLRDTTAADGLNGFYRHGELSVVVQKAEKKKIPYVGGEPDEALMKASAIEAGFSVDDLFCFYIVRQVPQWRRDGTSVRHSFEESYAATAPVIGAQLGYPANKEPSLEFFHKWFQTKMNKPFRAREVSADMVAPIAGGVHFTQRISAVVGRLRNQHILRVTEEMLNKYPRVLVVYGHSHFPMQQLALESMLGKPTRIADHP